jgi:hypothetical protein
MIEVSVEPSRLVVGRRTQLAIRFANTGQRACSGIVFKLRLPSAITLMGGANPAEIPVIPPGRVHAHQVTVEPTRAGDFELTSTNFSYRDEFDVPVRVTDFRVRLSVESAPPAPPLSARPVARLGIEHHGRELALGEWDVLKILVQNKTGVRLSDVTVAVSGPFKSDGKRARIGVLDDGATARFPFKVKADEGGRHVPVNVHTTYSYLDGPGSVRSQTQEDSLDVVVAKPGAPNTQPVTANNDVGEQTILNMAASPQDTEPPRSDLEMRKVKERLQRDVSSRGIFLSYRRADAAPYARLLKFQLTERFPDVHVFMDLDSIEAGLDFAEVIAEAVDSCAVLVALIGRQWATLADEEGHRRLDNLDDYVRFEVQTALDRGVRVIPVLVDGARPLQQEQLPPELHKLARLNALEMSYGRYEYDADRLLDLVQRVLAAGSDSGAPHQP